MPRPQTVTNVAIFEAALALMEARGSPGLTFAALAARIGLSGSTLVQRFGTKEALIHAALVHAWDTLDERTRRTAAEEPRTPEGAVAVLARLSEGYGDIESHADKLHLLREDFRHPELRERGRSWIGLLAGLLDECFGGPTRDGIGLMMIAQWQGAILLWGFSPQARLDDFVREHLRRFLCRVGLGTGDG